MTFLVNPSQVVEIGDPESFTRIGEIFEELDRTGAEGRARSAALKDIQGKIGV